MKNYIKDLEVKKNKVILIKSKEIITKEFLGENTLKSVIRELVNNLDYFYGTSEELMRKYLRTDFSEYTKDEIDDINLFYINTINLIIKVDKDISTEIENIIKETFKDERMFLVVKEELKRFDRFYIKRIDIPRIGIELDYTGTNKIQQKRRCTFSTSSFIFF